ncbi:MAG: hypothetical protein JSV49_07400 [Thermoplasmata archaeon]|nr:MAG: hypothetical protein JSV49_07400 [Thermoplasmata archaeon]
MAQERGKMIYEIKKPLLHRLIPIILTIVFIYIVGINWPIRSFLLNEEYSVGASKYDTGIFIFLIIIYIIITYLIYVTFKFFRHSYFLRLYEIGLLINRRRQSSKITPPKAYPEIISNRSNYELHLDDHFITYKKIVEIYAIQLELGGSERGGYIVVIEKSGKWSLIGIPYWVDMNLVLDNFKSALDYRWKKVFGGVY